SLKIGLKSSKEIKLSESAVTSANAKLTEISSNLYPQLSVGFNYNHLSEVPVQFSSPIFSATGGAIDALYANATIEQPLFTGLKLLSLRNAAEYGKEAALVQSSQTINEKAFTIHMSFWNLYRTEKLVKVLRENIAGLEKHLRDTELFFQNGLVTKNDLLKLKVRVSETRTQLIETENAFEIARAIYNKNLGFSLSQKTEISVENFEDNLTEYGYSQILEEAINSRSELVSNKYQSLAAEEKITAAKSTWFPQIGAFGSFNYLKVDGTQLLKSDWTNFWMVGVNVKWNIWDWWKTSSVAEQAEQQYNQVQLYSQILKENIEIEVYKNHLQLQSEASKVKVSKLRVESAEENYRIINDKYETQLVTSTELIDADSELLNAKTKLITSYINYKIAKVYLEKSIGRKIY
ncbi:MAG TPA: TolC family protein, partial [Bacteroidetes bacterium]|nr:TolC family protein [Bacteroidota bacterium]